MKVDNFHIIRPLLTFDNEDQFYFLQILQRKKDHNNRKVNGINNNSRLVQAYFVHSLEYLDFVKPEIIQLCEIFGARANINLNRRSYQQVANHTVTHILDQILFKKDFKAYKAWNTVCGQYHSKEDKSWLFDFDDEETQYKQVFLECMSKCRPGSQKVIAKIPSRAGFHLITDRFDLAQFSEFLKQKGINWNSKSKFISLHKNNPTNLYIP